MVVAFNISMKNSILALFLIAAIFMVPILSFEASADTASGSVGAGYNALCNMPSQCQSGKCLSNKCGCLYNRECGTGRTCTVATGICSLTANNYACTSNAQCQSGFCGSVTEFGRLCETCRTDTNCGTGKTCNTATGICVAGTSATVGSACRTDTDCASRYCKTTTQGNKVCACRTDANCPTGRTCNTATGACNTSGTLTGIDALIAEIKSLIGNMKGRIARMEGRL